MVKRLHLVGTQDGYRDGLEAIAALDPQWLLSEMTAEFAGVYLTHPEVAPVPLIHGVTAPAAVRLVLPYLPQELHAPTLGALWQVHMALLLTFTGDHGNERDAVTVALTTEVPA